MGRARNRLPSRYTSVVPSCETSKSLTPSTTGSVRNVRSRTARAVLFLPCVRRGRAHRQSAMLHTTLSSAAPAIFAEPVLGHRKRSDTRDDPVEVDAHCGWRRRWLGLRILEKGALRDPEVRRLERRPAARLQRDQIRARGARKAQFELNAVVDRIERSQRQEVQIPCRRDRTMD